MRRSSTSSTTAARDPRTTSAPRSAASTPRWRPVDGEPVIVKRFPDAFHLTALRQTLEDLGAGPDLVLAGFMTHMCVAATAQGGFEAGFRPTVVAEATATRSLPVPGGGVVSAEALQAASLAMIGYLFGTVVDTVDRLTP
ncbi:isochorismatase family protein [Stackebrandtia albiflava]|uniref:isochorismatase family protein n=1 Tax=Stackebrandtia albiflava TaxID=406432 RepID=UPI001FCE9C73|nr:isochorismatase family protein [Stackebrandtia albiflava]